MCLCNPDNRIPNCGSPECIRLAQAAEVLGMDEAPQPQPTKDALEIPAFLRRNNGEAAQDEKAEDTETNGADDVLLPGVPEQAPELSNAAGEAEIVNEAQADEELPLDESVPTLEDLAERIRKLRKKRAEIDETIRLLKVQGKKMWDRL